MAKTLPDAAILLTGGAGYIGTHIAWRLVAEGARVVVLDDLSTGKADALPPQAAFIRGDVRAPGLLRRVLEERSVDLVIHLAAKLIVQESVEQPLPYFETNVGGMVALVGALREAGPCPVVFSSTAAVYGLPQCVPIDEGHACQPVNPYGASKRAAEELLLAAGPAYGIRSACLRYFNVGGTWADTHPPRHSVYPTHVLPALLDAVEGRRPAFMVHGTDYPTADGTCIRDYVHVLDLADAHLLAARALLAGAPSFIANLGSGRGFSVRDLVRAVEAESGRPVPCQDGPRRPGDPPTLLADIRQAETVLGWRPRRPLEEIVRSEWRARKRDAGGPG